MYGTVDAGNQVEEKETFQARVPLEGGVPPCCHQSRLIKKPLRNVAGAKSG